MKELQIAVYPALLKKCPNLREISLEGTDGITDIGFVGLAEGCPNLNRMVFTYCYNITDIILFTNLVASVIVRM